MDGVWSTVGLYIILPSKINYVWQESITEHCLYRNWIVKSIFKYSFTIGNICIFYFASPPFPCEYLYLQYIKFACIKVKLIPFISHKVEGIKKKVHWFIYGTILYRFVTIIEMLLSQRILYKEFETCGGGSPSPSAIIIRGRTQISRVDYTINYPTCPRFRERL